jgi:hypothetical protein
VANTNKISVVLVANSTVSQIALKASGVKSK